MPLCRSHPLICPSRPLGRGPRATLQVPPSPAKGGPLLSLHLTPPFLSPRVLAVESATRFCLAFVSALSSLSLGQAVVWDPSLQGLHLDKRLLE